MKRFKQAVSIIEALQKHGFEAYFVGGSVRDYLIKRPIGDIDIATSALPEDVMRIFPHHVPVGLEHGTVIVLQQGIPYEVTTFRVEAGYEDFRRPSEVTFVRSLEEDLQRRDFTMNAIAMTKEGTIIDLYDGQAAIRNQLIQTVGNPNDRFQEDALRMMRGVRFVSTLGFLLEEQTKQAIINNVSLLEHIAIERITVEFEKLLLGSYCQQGLVLLVETNLYQYLPYLRYKQQHILQAAQYEWADIHTDIEAWAFLLYIANIEDPTTLLKSWKLSNKKIKTITSVLHFLYKRQEQQWDNMLLYEAGDEIAIMTERIHIVLNHMDNTRVEQVASQYKQLPIHSRKQLQITGQDLLEWGNKQAGPWVASVLSKIEQEVVCGNLTNSKEQIKEWLNECSLL
ncbi:CCA tRNA nucleotidyltransferase [Microbacteriaceae bacterium 4G12]